MVFYNSLNERKKKIIIKLLNSSELVIALSDKWKCMFESEFGLENCVSLNNGIDLEKYKGAINNVNDKNKEFLMLGRLGKEKGVYDLIDAVEEVVKYIPNIKVYMAGDGEVEKVRRIVIEKGLKNNIEVIGWVDDNKKIELLKEVGTIILPSYNEGLPMSILEGMACGKAVISTKVGAIPEVVKDKNGTLIEPGDKDELISTILMYCNNVEIIKEMSKENINEINKNYNMNSIHSKLAEFYELAYRN